MDVLNVLIIVTTQLKILKQTKKTFLKIPLKTIRKLLLIICCKLSLNKCQNKSCLVLLIKSSICTI